MRSIGGGNLEELIDSSSNAGEVALATLTHRGDGLVSILEPEHIIGRSRRCALVLAESYVSAQHALIRWNQDHWSLRDLGSRNGTTVNDTPLRGGDTIRLSLGDAIAFGHPDQCWEVSDTGPPLVSLRPIEAGQQPLQESHGLIEVDGSTLIFRDGDGHWNLESASEATRRLVDGEILQLDGRQWKFCCPPVTWPTSTSNRFAMSRVDDLDWIFHVSANEEHVQIVAELASYSCDLGDRSFNYLLLTLARQRLQDREDGLPEARCGWIHQEDLANALKMSSLSINTHVHRIRKHVAQIGVVDAANTVERRTRARELRIGVRRIQIKRL